LPFKQILTLSITDIFNELRYRISQLVGLGMTEYKTELRLTVEKAIASCDEKEAVELQELITYYSRIESTPRRDLMRRLMSEALLRDIRLRGDSDKLALEEAEALAELIAQIERKAEAGQTSVAQLG